MLQSRLNDLSYLVVAVLVVIVFTALACSQSTLPPTTLTRERDTETPAAVADTPEPAAPEATPSREPTPAPTGIEVEFEGIRFSLDETIATSAAGEIGQMTQQEEGGPWWMAELQHVVLTLEGYPLEETFHEPRIIVYPVHAFENMNEYAADQITRLRDLLAEQPAEVKDNLPFLPLFNAGQVIRAQVQYLDFQDGSGVRFLTQYSQDAGPINNDALFYTFQGLTDNGEYYIAAILPVSHPDLPADYQDTPEGFPKPGDTFGDTFEQTFEEFLAYYEVYLGEIVQQLNAADPRSFTPDLTALDVMIQSLSLVGPVATQRDMPSPRAPSGTDARARELRPGQVTRSQTLRVCRL